MNPYQASLQLNKIGTKDNNMTQEDKIKIELARLQGEFLGTLKGFLCWDIPNELKVRMQQQINKLENN